MKKAAFLYIFFDVIVLVFFSLTQSVFTVNELAPNAIADDVPVVTKSNRVALSSFTHFSYFLFGPVLTPQIRSFLFCKNHDGRISIEAYSVPSFRINSNFFSLLPGRIINFTKVLFYP